MDKSIKRYISSIVLSSIILICYGMIITFLLILPLMTIYKIISKILPLHFSIISIFTLITYVILGFIILIILITIIEQLAHK